MPLLPLSPSFFSCALLLFHLPSLHSYLIHSLFLSSLSQATLFPKQRKESPNSLLLSSPPLLLSFMLRMVVMGRREKSRRRFPPLLFRRSPLSPLPFSLSLPDLHHLHGFPFLTNKFDSTKYEAMFQALDVNGDSRLDSGEIAEFFKLMFPKGPFLLIIVYSLSFFLFHFP